MSANMLVVFIASVKIRLSLMAPLQQIPEDDVQAAVNCYPLPTVARFRPSAESRPLLGPTRNCCEPTLSQPRFDSVPNQHDPSYAALSLSHRVRQSEHLLNRRTAPEMA
jgi:hypothetical protein